MDAASKQGERDWGRDNQRANLFLLDSASFYLSARRLLLSNSYNAVMPGLVCAAYAIEQVIKAGLEYKRIGFPRGQAGHNLTGLAAQLSQQVATTNHDDLELFNAYFNSRYFDNADGAPSLTNEDYAKLDDLYYAFYKELDIPRQYHCKLGLLGSALDDSERNRADREILQLHNSHFQDYVELKRRSADSR